MKNNVVFIAAFVLLALFSYAEEWNYPLPDPNLDLKDISFYKGPASNELPLIASGNPRSVILLIGDGMGFNHISLARHKTVTKTGKLHMETLPVSGIVRTFSNSSSVTDSAAAITAIACGIKTDNGTIGMTFDNQKKSNIAELLDQKGWRTGLVATSTITHATPAGFAAHVEMRRTEADIALQMLDSGIDVLLGGGRSFWISGQNGLRKDDLNLIEQAKQKGYQFVYLKEHIADLKPNTPVLGLFADKQLTTYAPEPMLFELADTAISLLSAKSQDWFAPQPRFFLMIEGSQIDWASHQNNNDYMIRQLLLFDMAVAKAIDFARRDKNTLVIVVADHETGGLMLDKNKQGKGVVARWTSKSHTGVEVPLFAFGPGACRFSGAHDNTDIFKLIAELTGVHKPAAKPAITAAAK